MDDALCANPPKTLSMVTGVVFITPCFPYDLNVFVLYKAIDLLYKSCQNGTAAQEHLGGAL